MPQTVSPKRAAAPRASMGVRGGWSTYPQGRFEHPAPVQAGSATIVTAQLQLIVTLNA
jgi:hypothetical protein